MNPQDATPKNEGEASPLDEAAFYDKIKELDPDDREVLRTLLTILEKPRDSEKIEQDYPSIIDTLAEGDDALRDVLTLELRHLQGRDPVPGRDVIVEYLTAISDHFRTPKAMPRPDKEFIRAPYPVLAGPGEDGGRYRHAWTLFGALVGNGILPVPDVTMIDVPLFGLDYVIGTLEAGLKAIEDLG